MTENWLPVVGWEGRYEVSDLGRVRSLDRSQRGPYGSTVYHKGKVLSVRITRAGYATVTLCRDYDKRPRPVHQLVLEAFVGPRPDGMVACHGPAGKEDNRVSNLRWDTQSENVRDQLRHGTHPSGASLDACSRGHAYTPENVYWVRRCRTCSGGKNTNAANSHVLTPSTD